MPSLITGSEMLAAIVPCDPDNLFFEPADQTWHARWIDTPTLLEMETLSRTAGVEIVQTTDHPFMPEGILVRFTYDPDAARLDPAELMQMD